MALEFVYGPASCQHEQPLVEKAAAWLAEDPEHEVFYLVPNHVKFETEVSVLQNLHQLPAYHDWQGMSTMRLQVFSFTRLAWYYLQHTANYQAQVLSEAGVQMLIRKLLLANSEQLYVFRGEINHSGFVAQLADLFQELQNGNITELDLAELLTNLGNSLKEVDFKAKMREFNLLYHAYLEAIVNHQVGTSQLLADLAAHLAEADLSKVMIVITGFSRFNAAEQTLLKAIMIHAAEVKLDLVLDQPYTQEPPEMLEMFYDTGKLYFELYQFARYYQVNLLKDTRLHLVADSPLAQLDEVWQDSQKLTPAVKRTPLGTDQIQIWQGANPYTEVSHVAREIRHLVATTDIRYQDIEILSRDLSYYEHFIGPVFKSYELPYYLNQELAMKHHPLLEFLETLFAIKQRFYRYHDVMRFLRTELFLPQTEMENVTLADWERAREAFRKQVDITENIALAHGFEGAAWSQEKDWHYIYYQDTRTEDAQEDLNTRNQRISNDVRRQLRSSLMPFYEEMAAAKTGRDGAVALYTFLIKNGIDRQLLWWRDQGIAAGDLEGAKIHEQTWQALTQLLDEYVELLGEDPFVLADFIDILTTGLEGLTYNKVPTTLDQITVSSLDLIHAQKNRVTFIIGATDQVLPQKIENKTLLSDEERGLVANHLSLDKFLNKNTTRDLGKEPFIAYLAFTSTKERLYLTYPRTSEQSAEAKISPYVARLSQSLGIAIQVKETLPAAEEVRLAEIGTYRSLITDLSALKRKTQEEGKFLAPLWLKLEERLLNHEKYAGLAAKTLSSLTHKNIPEALSQPLVKALYGETIYGSVSKIESFYECQYKYFMTYGLQLKERETFELSPAAAGDFYHDALDQLFKALSEGVSLSDLTPLQVKELTNKVLLQLLTEPKFAILNSSNRMNYIRYQLSQTIQQVSGALRRQSQRTGLSTVQTEILFGQIADQIGLRSLDYDVGQQQKLSIRGKIDRLDSFQLGETSYLAVVDYKSSRHTFDYREAYFGLAMQMITYLDVALKNAVKLVGNEHSEAAGAFYLHVKNPKLEGLMSLEKAPEEFLKEFRLDGLLVQEEPILERLDVTLEEQDRSSVFALNRKKNGDYTSSQFVTQDELGLLRQKNEANFISAGQDIFAGSTKLNPAYQDKTRVACRFCSFRSICQFDVMLKENEYHRIPKMTKAEVLASIESGEENNK